MKKTIQYALIKQYIGEDLSLDGIKSMSYNKTKQYALLLEGALMFEKKWNAMKIEEMKSGDTILLKDTDSTGNRKLLTVKNIKKTLNEEFIVTCSISGHNYDRDFGEDKFLKIIKTQSL